MRKQYVYHTQTRNLSFLQTARDLKRLGIKNNMFFLALYDTDLTYVNPYDTKLSSQLIMKIINECIINPWYFIREIARIPEQGGDGIPYQLNRANLAATWCFLNGIDHYEVIPRQIGKTQSTIAILNWAFLFGTTNSEFMFINIKQENANANLARLKEQRDILPKYLQFKLVLSDDGKLIQGGNNVTTLDNKSNGNKIVTKPSATSKERAENIGRGCTQPIQYYDEVEFTDWIKDIVEAAGPAFNTASDNAKRNNAAYCRIFTSTPGDLDTRSCKQALEIIQKTTKWSEEFYEWSIDEVHDYIDNNADNKIVYIEYQYQQLGKDEKWFKKICGVLNNEPPKIKREVFLKRLRGSSDSPFEEQDLEALESHRGEIKEEIFINKLFRFALYDKIIKSRIYMIGVDVATGTGGDNTAIIILDPYTLKVVGEFASSLIGITDLQKVLSVLIKKYIPRGILCIERNHNGEAVLDNLRNSPYKMNLYHDTSKEFLSSKIDEKLDEYGMLKQEAARRRFYGVYTHGKSREIMFNLLFTHMAEFKDRFVSNNIIDDIMGLVRNKRGKIEAGIGNHDDSIMAYLIVLYVYYYGNNLSRYGFIKGELPDEEKQNKGLNYNEILDEMDETTEQFFSQRDKTISEYQDNIREEIERARRFDFSGESSMYTTRTENLDKDEFDEYSVDYGDDFFDELND